MRRLTWTSRAALVLLVAGASASAQQQAVQAELSCRPEAAPGRVLCELKYSAPSGARIVWADALVTRAPEFARPLRSRVSPGRFQDDADERKLTFAFVATSAGVGTVEVQARAVVCRGTGAHERCRPQTLARSAELRVGS